MSLDYLIFSPKIIKLCMLSFSPDRKIVMRMYREMERFHIHFRLFVCFFLLLLWIYNRSFWLFFFFWLITPFVWRLIWLLVPIFTIDNWWWWWWWNWCNLNLSFFAYYFCGYFFCLVQTLKNFFYCSFLDCVCVCSIEFLFLFDFPLHVCIV